MAVLQGVSDLSVLIGHNIRSARLHVGLSQAELAARTQVVGFPLSRCVISKIERAAKQQVLVYDLYVIAQALSVPVDSILRGEYRDESAADCHTVGE